MIDLRSLEIASLRPRKAVTGTIIYEVPGEISQSKADDLAAKLREKLNPKEIKVARPTKMVEFCLSGLDDMTDNRTEAEAMAAVGGYAT